MSDDISKTEWGTDYILGSVKKQLGIQQADESFDIDLINSINMSLAKLSQLGAYSGTWINNADKAWDDPSLSYPENSDSDVIKFLAKQYVYLNAKLVFDPPTNSAVLQSYERQISELEWRIAHEAEIGTKS